MFNSMTNLIIFVIGIISGFALVGIWRSVQLWGDSRAAKAAANRFIGSPFDDPRDKKAYEKVESCKKHLRWQKKPEQEWIAPLIEEVPKLIKEIAEVYYPDNPDPVRAPGLSHFMRAIHLAAKDIADFLQTRRVGRLIDISANTALKTWEAGRRISKNEQVKALNKWYKRVRPVWRMVRYKSPWMWISFAASNLASRTLQPAVIDIVARRAIELYSGRLVCYK